MWGLFETNAGEVGYRLKTLEIFNWGTFHEGKNKADIWKINPEGQNSLLTGANGSGKTTLVDALLALLVNPTKRFFNQSSGAASKKDRTERSYVEGHYGLSQSEEQQNARTQKLRPNNHETYSVILGVFINQSSTTITLIQVRWFSGNELKHKYIVAKTELSISQHIQFSSDGTWLRKLKRQFGDRLKDFDTFSKYASDFQQHFGMKSEKALSLFNQTVGMKVLGDLDEFIRTNMLEESTAEADFAKLIGQYQSLLVLYQALEKAKIQLDLLKPVYDLDKEYQQLKTEIKHIENQKRFLVPWFAQQQIKIWGNEIKNQDAELDRLGDKLGQEEQNIDSKGEQRFSLELAIGNNEINQKIKDLDRDIKDMEKSKSQKERDLKDYNNLVRKLAFTENPDEASFQENLKNGQDLQTKLLGEKNELEDKKFVEKSNLEKLKNDFEQLKNEINQLENSSNKITGRVAEIHQEILEAVGASRNEIPFVAELIQVKPEEKAIWNVAIEKLLHSFGLCLLVPDKYYSSVNQYVKNHKDLKGKIKYFHVGKATPSIMQDPRALVTKLDFNTKSQYATWVESRIAGRYNYFCVEEQATFERLDKAILPSGLSRNKDSYERDDTQNNRQILGWDNRELLRQQKLKGREVSEKIGEIERSLQKTTRAFSDIDNKEKVLTLFLEIKQFSKLNWQSDAEEISKLQKQKTEIENSNAALTTLQK